MDGHRLHVRHTVILLALSLVLFFAFLGSYSLKEPDEGRYAEIPREMVEQGDYIVPHLNYVRYFEKPPLLYWAVAASYKIFGTHEWGFRIPNALFALISVMGLYFMCRRWFPETVSFNGALILATSFGFFALARIVTTDMLFSTFLLLTLLFFYGYYREGKTIFLYLFYACCGFATLAKGIGAVLLPGLAIVIFLVFERKLSFITRMRWFSGILVYCAITLPWFIAIALREKEFLHFFFIDQHLLRFATTIHKRSGPLYYFIPVLLAGMLPWSVFIPRALAHGFKRRELRLFFIWTIVVFIFFSFSRSKLPPYILPIFPTLSILIASFIQHQRDTLKPERICLIVLLLLSSVLVFFAVPMAGSFISEDILQLPHVKTNLWISAIVMASASVFVSVVLLIKPGIHPSSRLIYAPALFSVVVFLSIFINLTILDSERTAKNISREILSRSGTYDRIIIFNTYEQTLPFYLKKRVTLASYTGELKMGAGYEEAKPYFLDLAAFAEAFRSKERLLVVTNKKRLDYFRSVFPDRHTVLTCSDEKCLLSNR